MGLFAFPGNVRQLENICHWLTVMAPAQVIEPKDLPPEVLAASDALLAPSHAQTVPPAAADVPAIASSALHAGHDAAMAGQAANGPGMGAGAPDAGAVPWEQALGAEAMEMLVRGKPEVWDLLTRRFESRMIEAALLVTKGRRIEAAQKLGIGRNTITRKIQELGLE